LLDLFPISLGPKKLHSFVYFKISENLSECIKKTKQKKKSSTDNGIYPTEKKHKNQPSAAASLRYTVLEKAQSLSSQKTSLH